MTKSKGTIRIIRYESSVLAGNPLGDPANRDLYIYLPPGYEESEDQYPVVYCLTGFAGRGKMLLNESAFEPNLAQRLDNLIESGSVVPMIAVMPDCFTRYGGSQFINSTATGRYEDYIVDELVPFVDSDFRTIANRYNRAVTGISSGGYGSMIMALRHSDVFGLSASIAGDCYFEMSYKPNFGKAFRGINGNPEALIERTYDETISAGKYDFDGLNAIGMASCYSPNADSERGYDLPFDLETGILREDIWERWLEHDPVSLIEEHADSLQSMRLIYLDAGKSDEFNLDIGARVLCKKLAEHGILFVHEEFDGGHFHIKHRFNQALVTISKFLKNASV